MSRNANSTTAASLMMGLFGIAAGAVAFALLVGAGAARLGHPVVVVVSAGLLVLLPALGLTIPLRGRPGALPGGMLIWGLLVMMGFPLYFPGERQASLTVGLDLLLSPLGFEAAPELAGRMSEALPETQARPVPPVAQALAEAIRPSRPTSAEDEVVLPYEGDGRTLTIPVTFESGGSERELWLLYDTGATLTTLDAPSLSTLGITVPEDAPRMQVRTAGGERETSLVLLDRVWLGGFPVEGVTVAVCEHCADSRDDTVGLLGLNVSGLFKTTVDSQRDELVLRPQGGASNRRIDVAPWLDISATGTRWEDGRFEVEVVVFNRSPRLVRRADVAIVCTETWLATLTNVPPSGQSTTTVSLPLGVDCGGYGVKLQSADW